MIAQMVASCRRCIFVQGGDFGSPRPGRLGALGARLRRDEKAGGFVVEHVRDDRICRTMPPLSRAESRVKTGK